MATQFQQAFQNKGLYKEVIQKIEDDAKKQQMKEEKEREKRNEEIRQQSIEDRMDREEYSKFKQHIIDMQYITAPDGKQTIIEKGTAKLFHILCSHIPFHKSHKAILLEGKQSNCCFCGRGILPLNDLLTMGGDVMLKSLQAEVKAYSEGKTEEERVKASKEVWINTFRDKKIGYTSDETTTVICTPCYEQFVKWIHNELFNENPLIKSAMKKQGFWKTWR